MSGYILYGGRFTRAMICEMVFAELGIDYELREVDMTTREHRSESYLAVNPAALIPSLVTPEGQILYETPAISLYLAEKHGDGDLAPLPDDPDRGIFLSALFFITDELEPVFKRYFYPQRYVADQKDIEQMKQDSLTWAGRLLSIIEQRLEDGTFSVGNRFTIVDITLAYWMEYFSRLIPMADLPRVMEVYRRTERREKLIPCFTRLGQMRVDYEEREKQGSATNW